MNLATSGKVNNIIKESGVFVPKELTSSNIRAMLAQCSAKPDSKNITKTFVFQKDEGFNQDYAEYVFDQDVLDKQFDNIAYMLGQLYNVHSKVTTKVEQVKGKVIVSTPAETSNMVTLEYIIYNYKKELWTANTQEEATKDAYALIALGTTGKNSNKESMIGYLQTHLCERPGCLINHHVLKPTLSPKDPNYVDPRSEADLALSVQKVSKICKAQGIAVTDEEILKMLQR